ncbi:hypothetical protein ACHAW6_008405 [Cyclotella cf. meneghiniana]
MSLVLSTLTSRHSKKTSKLNRNSFPVDRVAGNERIDEEYKVRLRSIDRNQVTIKRQQERAKNKIFLLVQQEENELENLRKEKRKILEEMKRLKALIELERANSHRKHDCQAAQLAEQRRHAANSEKKAQRIRRS